MRGCYTFLINFNVNHNYDKILEIDQFLAHSIFHQIEAR